MSHYKLRIFTDHRNLEFVLRPNAAPGPIGVPRMSRLERWALILQAFDYSIHYYPGELNGWADLFSRSMAPTEVRICHIWDPFAHFTNSETDISEAHAEMPPLVHDAPQDAPDTSVGPVSDSDARIVPADADNLTWFSPLKKGVADDDRVADLNERYANWQEMIEPAENDDELWAYFPPMDDLVRTLRVHSALIPDPPVEGSVFDAENSLWIVAGKTFIPDAQNLRDRIVHLFHNALHVGHFGLYTVLAERYYWPGLQHDVERCTRNCLDCLISHGVSPRRPYGQPMHASGPDEIIHFDYLDMPEDGAYGFKKILVVKDDFSGMVEFFPSHSADAAHVARSLMEWFSRHRLARVWISDTGSHFKNQVMELLAKEMGVNHHFVAPYSPWANGTIEVVNRDFLRLMRALLSGHRMHEESWVYLLDVVTTAINMTPSAHRGGYSPFELYTGRSPSTVVDVVVNPLSGVREHPLDSTEVVKYLEDLRAHLADVHAAAEQHMKDRREANRRRRNAQGVDSSTFDVGDFVLVAQRGDANKLQARWLGPARVTRVMDDGFVYDLEFDTDPPYHVTRHIAFVRPFKADLAGDSVPVRELLRHHLSSRRGVAAILDLRRKGRGRRWMALIQPMGFDEEDAVEIPLREAHRIAPDLLKAYLSQDALPSAVKQELPHIRKYISRL